MRDSWGKWNQEGGEAGWWEKESRERRAHLDLDSCSKRRRKRRDIPTLSSVVCVIWLNKQQWGVHISYVFVLAELAGTDIRYTSPSPLQTKQSKFGDESVLARLGLLGPSTFPLRLICIRLHGGAARAPCQPMPAPATRPRRPVHFYFYLSVYGIWKQ